MRMNGVRFLLEGTFEDRLTLESLTAYLTGLPKTLGMTRLSEPMVVEQGDYIAGLVVIAESHIAVHELKVGLDMWAGTIDVSTCKPETLDRQEVVRYSEAAIGFRVVKEFSIDWGTSPLD